MSIQSPPVKLNYAKRLFRLIFDCIEFSTIELTEHFTQRQRERGIDLVDLMETIDSGYIKKEYKPDRDHPQWRWSLQHKDITIIFNIHDKLGITFITCWRGDEPREGNQ